MSILKCLITKSSKVHKRYFSNKNLRHQFVQAFVEILSGYILDYCELSIFGFWIIGLTEKHIRRYHLDHEDLYISISI